VYDGLDKAAMIEASGVPWGKLVRLVLQFGQYGLQNGVGNGQAALPVPACG
jgi:hypothetical protein